MLEARFHWFSPTGFPLQKQSFISSVYTSIIQQMEEPSQEPFLHILRVKVGKNPNINNERFH